MKIPKRRFIAGPAAATSMCPVRMLSLRVKWRGLTSTGLPQPNPSDAPPVATSAMSGNRSVPIGSAWATGFRVVRPWLRGSGSPSLSATMACPNSWTQMDSTRMMSAWMIVFMWSPVRSMDYRPNYGSFAPTGKAEARRTGEASDF
jgi:hypothetical protein